jgi:hypothetical protein
LTTAQLKAARDKFLAAGIAVYIPAVRSLLDAVNAHIVADESMSAPKTVSAEVVVRATALQAQVHELENQMGSLKASSTDAQSALTDTALVQLGAELNVASTKLAQAQAASQPNQAALNAGQSLVNDLLAKIAARRKELSK